MASTSQKKTTKKTSGKSGSRTTAKKPQPRPIRREVGGVVCLVLALCVFVSYFGISAIFIDWLAVLIKGLLGYGYWLFGPALVLAGCILLFHHGRPVTLRVTSALLLPVLLIAGLILLLLGRPLIPPALRTMNHRRRPPEPAARPGEPPASEDVIDVEALEIKTESRQLADDRQDS